VLLSANHRQIYAFNRINRPGKVGDPFWEYVTERLLVRCFQIFARFFIRDYQVSPDAQFEKATIPESAITAMPNQRKISLFWNIGVTEILLWGFGHTLGSGYPLSVSAIYALVILMFAANEHQAASPEIQWNSMEKLRFPLMVEASRECNDVRASIGTKHTLGRSDLC
jgi:hypothetical protein